MTGAGRGIGRAIALGLASEGASVALLARSEAEIVAVREELESRRNKGGATAAAVPCDVTDPASMAGFFRRMGESFQDEPNEHMDEIIGRLDHGERVEQALDLHMHDHGGGDVHDGGDAAD